MQIFKIGSLNQEKSIFKIHYLKINFNNIIPDLFDILISYKNYGRIKRLRFLFLHFYWITKSCKK